MASTPDYSIGFTREEVEEILAAQKAELKRMSSKTTLMLRDCSRPSVVKGLLAEQVALSIWLALNQAECGIPLPSAVLHRCCEKWEELAFGFDHFGWIRPPRTFPATGDRPMERDRQ
jgi:hypothetical protein